MGTLKDWVRETRQGPVYADLKRCSLIYNQFHNARLEIQVHLRRLNVYMGGDDHRKNAHNREECRVDPSVAWRAVRKMGPKLEGIDIAL
jgi:hypothetical protein